MTKFKSIDTFERAAEKLIRELEQRNRKGFQPSELEAFQHRRDNILRNLDAGTVDADGRKKMVALSVRIMSAWDGVFLPKKPRKNASIHKRKNLRMTPETTEQLVAIAFHRDFVIPGNGEPNTSQAVRFAAARAYAELPQSSRERAAEYLKNRAE
jgi:hypothetical protein